MIVTGALTGAPSGYAGHGVEVTGRFTVPDVGENVALALQTTADDGGRFVVDYGAAIPSGDPRTVTVRAPDGTRLLSAEFDAAATEIRLEVAPSTPIPIVTDVDPLDPALGPLTLRVHVLDRLRNEPSPDRLVALYGRVPQRGRGAEPGRVIVAADHTDAAGTVRLSYARARYAALDVELPGTAGAVSVHPVPMQKGVPAEELRLVADFPAVPADPGGHAGDHTDDGCGCRTETPPRVPDHADLVSTDGVYSTDLGSPTCPTPAVPNRTIEEYRYHSLVRTTDPFLLGATPRTPQPLGDRALDTLTELAYGFGSLDTGIAAGSGTGGGLVGGGTRAGSLDDARLASERYFGAGLLAARAWRETARDTDPRAEIVARAAALSDEALRHALADPDGFTPVSLMTAERHDAIERVRRQLLMFGPAASGRRPVDQDNMPDWDADEGTYQAATVAHGHLLEWRQVWRADGYSLGDLCYSLPLAPGQKRTVAVVDWDRDERSFRDESRTVTENLEAELSRTRAVHEVVRSTVTESIDAGSSTNIWAAGGGLGLGIPFSGGFFGLGVAGGGGGSSSQAWQDSARAVGSSSAQQLADRLDQASNAVRSQRASVVVGSEQAEGLSITSEVVANHNHCHAMTVEYFEVLQHFRVDQELADVRECLFVPLSMRPFDLYKALRWRDVLAPRLRRPQWASGFDAIERILLGYSDSGYPPGRYADEPIGQLWGELTLELSIARPRDRREDEPVEDYLDSAWDFWGSLFGPDSSAKAYDASIADRALADQIFAREYAPRVARRFCESLTISLTVTDPATGSDREEALSCDVTMVSGYRPGGHHRVTFRATSVPAGVTRAMVRAVRIGSALGDLSPNSTTVLRRSDVRYATAYREHALVRDRWLSNDVRAGDPAVLGARFLSRDEERNPRQDDAERLAGLLKHLNEYVEHYHQVIWWRMDPNRRFMLLDGFVAPNSGGRSLASVVENRLISIVGNALVLPVSPGYQLDPGIRSARRDGDLNLLEAYRPPVPVPPRRISLPTRGVHAEAILGECNSCEVRDDTLFWDWASEPIPDNEPTPIADIGTGTRRQVPADTTPTELTAPVVAIQNAPAAPDPTPIGDLATLLTTANLFKDVTGLEGNQANALAAFQESLKTANAFGKMAASGAKSAFANRSGERVMRKVQEAQAAELLSDDDAKQVVSKLFGVMNGGAEDTDKPLTEDPAVQQAMEKVNAAEGPKKVTVTATSGSTSQTVETTATTPTSTASAPTVDFRITGVPPLLQPSPLTCWAVALTMLVSHDRQQSIPTETVLASGGQQYVDLFTAGSALPIEQVPTFRSDFGLRDVSFGALTAAAVESALRAHGPLWVVADEDASPGFSLHARVITGIVGDGTASGTTVVVNDPGLGQETQDSLVDLAEKLRQLSDGFAAAFGGVSPTVLAL